MARRGYGVRARVARASSHTATKRNRCGADLLRGEPRSVASNAASSANHVASTPSLRASTVLAHGGALTRGVQESLYVVVGVAGLGAVTAFVRQ